MMRKVSVLAIALLLVAQTFTGLINPAYAAVAGNIITKLILTDNQGKVIDAALDPDYRVKPGSIVKLDYEWGLENGHGYKKGDTFNFTIDTKLFSIFNEVTGDLIIDGTVKAGTFKLNMAGDVVMTFNDEVEKRSEVKGKLNFQTWFQDESKIQESEVVVKVPIKGNQEQKFTVLFDPDVSETIVKSVKPNRPVNPGSIEWSIDVNKKLERLTEAEVKDKLQQGLAMPANVEVYRLKVKTNGDTELGDKLTSGYTFTPDLANNEFSVKLGDINSAYRIVLTTDLTERLNSFKNKATLTSKGKQPITSNEPVITIVRGKPLDKKSAGYDPITQTVDWEINYNYSLDSIPAGKAVLKDLFDDKHKLDGDVEVYEVSFDASGNPVQGKKLSKSDYTQTPISDVQNNKAGFELKFPGKVDQAYKIKYKTKAAGNVYEGYDLNNTVETETDTITVTQTISQKFLNKSHSKANYKDKTVPWTVKINENGYKMDNLVFTDTLKAGLELDSSSIQVKSGTTQLVENQDYELTPTQTSFEIKFKGTVAKELTISYTTAFDYESLPAGTIKFDNEGSLSGDVYELDKLVPKTGKITAEFVPDTNTTANGYKSGTYDASTKELTWKIGFNYNNRSIKTPVVQDELQAGQKYVSGSLKVHHMTL